MQYSIIIPAALAVLAQAAPQAIKINYNGPARITNIDAEASRVIRIMNSQSPVAANTKTVTVTGRPATITGTVKAIRKTHKPRATKKPNKHAKRAVTTKALAVTTTAATTTATSPTNVNTACATQPVFQSYYPPGNASDPQVFLKDSTINSAAANAATPPGYNWMWSNYMMQTTTRGFLGLYQLSSYNVSQCATYCDKTAYCASFNIFYERNPSLNPGDGCLNPSPIASIRCTLWDSRLDIYTATNYGQWRAQFPVVVAGSNGYAKP